MIEKGLFVRLESKPDKVEDVKSFLKDAEPIVDDEQDTIAWFAIQLGPTTFGIFDVFEDEDGQEAHLNGDVATALNNKASELFAEEPSIEKADVLATKMP